MSSKIENITRSRILLCVNSKRYEFCVEAYLPGFGSPNFDIFASDTREIIDGVATKLVPLETSEDVLAILTGLLEDRGLTYELIY